ncbi:MAG: EamA family transporter [Anaerolineae bacterium]|nr:EamA family transporter [Anaerolineae bacterium]
MTKQRAWIGFWILALIWGSSFLFIRIGVEQLTTFQVVFIRTLIAAIGLNIVAYARGKHLPTDWKGIRDLLILGIVNTVFPFVLITWGEKSIESSLAAILQGTAALFTMVVAHFVFLDERMTTRKIVGLIIGFLGVIILASRSTDGEVIPADATLHLLGQLAIVAASFCYALGGTYSRKAIQNHIEPIIAAAGAMTVTAIISGILTYVAPLLGGPSPTPLGTLTPRVIGAMLALGLVNTFIAYIIFYALIPVLGAARTSLVTYVIPAVGLILGAIFLGEAVDIRLLIGAAMIMGSIGIVNLKFGNIFRRTPAPQPQVVNDGTT